MPTIKNVTRVIFAVLFAAAGLNHFVNPAFYETIVPPYLPWPRALVIISGFAEIALGVGLMIPKLSRFAAWGIIALLAAVFPANIHMATHPELYPSIPDAALWLRLPIQGFLAVWAYWYTRSNAPI